VAFCSIVSAATPGSNAEAARLSNADVALPVNS